MAAIEFGTPDSSGDYPNSLASPRPTPADRFFEFVPDVVPVGPRRTALGDGSTHEFRFRRDYTARLVIRHLAPSQLTTALDLKDALLAGESVNVVTSDSASHEYVCTLKPGTEPVIENMDDGRLHFAFSCELRSSSKILVTYT